MCLKVRRQGIEHGAHTVGRGVAINSIHEGKDLALRGNQRAALRKGKQGWHQGVAPGQVARHSQRRP